MRNFWKLPPVDLHSSLDLNTAIQRLQDAVDTDRVRFAIRKDSFKPVLGIFSGAEFRIRKRWAWFYDKQIGEYFWGTIAQDRSGTRITGYYALAPSLRAAGFTWFALMSSIATVGFAFLLRGFLQARFTGQLIGLAFGILLLTVLWPWLLQRVWRIYARRHEDFLIRFLKGTLDAWEVPRATDLMSAKVERK